MMAHIHENDLHLRNFETLRMIGRKTSVHDRGVSQVAIANLTVLLVSVSALAVFYTLDADSVAMLGESSIKGLAIGGIWYVSTVIRCLLNANCVAENALSGILTITFSLITDQTYAVGILLAIGIGHFLLTCIECSRLFRTRVRMQ